MHVFLDGPAAGVTLDCRRAPVFLRVVRGSSGAWDALDQMADQPAAGERVWVYVLQGPPLCGFLCCRGAGRSRSGYHESGEYRALAPGQPADADLRDNTRWAAWVEAHAAALLPEWYRRLQKEANDPLPASADRF